MLRSTGSVSGSKFVGCGDQYDYLRVHVLCCNIKVIVVNYANSNPIEVQACALPSNERQSDFCRRIKGSLKVVVDSRTSDTSITVVAPSNSKNEAANSHGSTLLHSRGRSLPFLLFTDNFESDAS